METIKSVVSLKGGRYPGIRDQSVRNCLWLCPNHQTLFERGLVRIKILERRDVSELDADYHRLVKRIKSSELGEDDIQAFEFCEVPKAEFNVKTGSVAYGTWTRMVFRVEHLRVMLEWFREYLERSEGS
jgi:hypothetical protein